MKIGKNSLQQMLYLVSVTDKASAIALASTTISCSLLEKLTGANDTLRTNTLTENKIISVVPTVPTISITWMLGARCNYDCMYCSTDQHDSVSKHPSLDKLVQGWNSFYSKVEHIGLPVKISFTGGEVTANKSFLPLLRYIRNGEFDIEHIGLSTNGSASLKYYQKLSQLVDSMSFSFHSEHADEKEFFIKARAIDQLMIRPQKSFQVSVMDEFWNQDRIKMYIKWLEKHDIHYSVNTINYKNQTRTIPIFKGISNFDQL